MACSLKNASRRFQKRKELKYKSHTFRVLVQRQDMTGAERSWASHYEIDDVVRYTRGSKAIGIEAAAYASVVAINPAANELTVKKANGELATYDPRRLTGVSVYQRDRTRVLRRRPHPVYCPRQIARRCKSRHGHDRGDPPRWSPIRPPRQQPPDRIQPQRASSSRPRLRRYQS